MPDTMIERVGRAMALADDEDYMEAHREYDRRARVAIAAMRDCDAGSPAILVAGKTALYSCSEDPELADARGCWHAMIDAALAEEG